MKWFYFSDYKNNPFFLKGNFSISNKKEKNLPLEDDIVKRLIILQRTYQDPSLVYKAVVREAMKNLKDEESLSSSDIESENDLKNSNNSNTENTLKNYNKEKFKFLKASRQIKNLEILPDNYCSDCHLIYPEDNDHMICCNFCHLWVHYQCEGLSLRYYNKVVPKLRSYECKSCKYAKHMKQKYQNDLFERDELLLKFLYIMNDKIDGGNSSAEKSDLKDDEEKLKTRSENLLSKKKCKKFQ